MIRWDRERFPMMCEGLLQLAVAQYVQWWRCYVVPNLCLWHEMDVAVLTRAGCLWEFEIKCSQRDWDGDNRKDAIPERRAAFAAQFEGTAFAGRFAPRPTRNLKYVERFHYVVAPGLVAPGWLPEWAGILRAEHRTSWYGREGDYVTLVSEKRAKRRRAEKPTDHHREKILGAAYHRFWNRVMALPVPEAVACVGASLSRETPDP